MTKKVLLGMTIFLLLLSFVIANSHFNDFNSNVPVGQGLYKGLTFVEVKAKGTNTGGGHVAGEQYRIELTVVFEVATDKVMDILYTNTGIHTTGGNYEKLWTGKSASSYPHPNHVRGYPELIKSFIGKTAQSLSQVSTNVAGNGANMPDAVTGATQTTSNFTSSVKKASEEYLRGNAVKSTWKKK